ADTEKTQAAAASTKASNQWAYYQAKKLRQHFYDVSGEMLKANARDGSADAKVAEWKALSARYAKDTEEIKEKAEGYEQEEKACDRRAEMHDAKADKKVEEAEELAKHSEHMHHKSDRYDLAEMSVELGLVVCSVAILVRRRQFWYGGMGLAVVGMILAI